MLAVPEIITSRSEASIAREKLGGVGPYSRGYRYALTCEVLERQSGCAAGEPVHLHHRVAVAPADAVAAGKRSS